MKAHNPTALIQRSRVSGVSKDDPEGAGSTPSPGWERGRGEGRTMQDGTLRFTLLGSPPAVLFAERAFPHP